MGIFRNWLNENKEARREQREIAELWSKQDQTPTPGEYPWWRPSSSWGLPMPDNLYVYDNPKVYQADLDMGIDKRAESLKAALAPRKVPMPAFIEPPTNDSSDWMRPQ